MKFGLADAASSVVIGAALVIGYLAILWVALAFYVLRDARRRSTSMSFMALALVLGFIPPFLGSLIYLVVRPPRTLEEEHTLELEEIALREPISETVPVRPCPSCGRDIDTDFVVCPYCRTQFSRRCSACDRVLRLGWPVCPYCATEVGVQPLRHGSRTAS